MAVTDDDDQGGGGLSYDDVSEEVTRGRGGRDAIERLQNFDLGLYLTIFLSKYDYKEYRTEAHKNLSSSIVRMHEGTIFDDY